MRMQGRILGVLAVLTGACGGNDAQFCQEYSTSFTGACTQTCITTAMSGLANAPAAQATVQGECTRRCGEALTQDATYASRCAALSAAPGMSGMPGRRGYPGMSGVPGMPASPGIPGFPGMTGSRGMPGFPGMTGMPMPGAPGTP